VFSCDRRAPLLLALACAWALAACGQLPRPFQPEDKPLPDIAEAEVEARAGVFVAPLPGEDSERLTGALVAALQAADVAASRHARNRASHRISARLGESGSLRWSLVAPGGETLLAFNEAPGAESIGRVAQMFALFLNPEPPPPPEQARPALAVPPVDGAPGDGRLALALAMRQALAAEGFPTDHAVVEAAYLVLGSVHVEKVANSAAEERVSVDWTVLGPDGARLGTVSQSNQVAAGTLDGTWGAVARVVAQNGAQGVVALLARLGALQ
jgi:hypothetical protein